MARRCHTETEKGKLFLKISAIINGQCIIVPTEAVMKNLPEANGTKLKVLLCVLASPEFDADALCEQLDITKKTPYTVKCTAALIYTALYVKSEKNNISVFYDIFLSFGTDKSLFPCGIV